MVKKSVFAITSALCLTLTGCGDRLLERSYSSVVPHSAAYWEKGNVDTLRAENYQELVNALLILLGEHSEDGVVRVYGEYPDKSRMVGSACVEVQKETAIGAYLLDYITYDGKDENGCYELTVRFGYRRTAEEQAAIVNATSTEALPSLLRAAVEEGVDAVAVRIGWFGTDRDGAMALVEAVHRETFPSADADAEAPPEAQEPALPDGDAAQADETPQEPAEEAAAEAAEEGEEEAAAEPPYDISPWEVFFYPNDVSPGIIEVRLNTEQTKGGVT